MIACLLLPVARGGEPAWSRLEAGDFIIQSDASKADIEACALRYTAFRRAFSALFLHPGDALPASTYILFKKEKAFYASVAPNDASSRTSARLYYSCEVDGRLTVAVPLTSGVESVAQTLAFETSFLLRELGYQLPIWMDQGLGAMMTTVAVRKDQCVVGDDGEFTFREYLPWPDFFNTWPGSYAATGDARGLVDYTDQSWGLMHWIVFAKADPLERVDALARHQDRLRRPMVLIAQVMQTPAEKFTAAIKAHFTTPRQIPFDQAARKKTFKWSVLSPAEVLVQKCNLLAAAGYGREAGALLDTALQTSPELPSILEADARRQLRTNHPTLALQRYRAAIEAGSENWFTYLQSAESRLEAVQSGTDVGPAVATELEIALRELRTARRLNPHAPSIYRTLAALWKVSPRLDPSAIDDFADGVRLHVQGPAIRFERALLYARLGDRTTSIAELRAILATPQLDPSISGPAKQRLREETIGDLDMKMNTLAAAKRYSEAYILIEKTEKESDFDISGECSSLHAALDRMVRKDPSADPESRARAAASWH